MCRIRDARRPIPDIEITTPGYERAARLFDRRRARGVTGGSIELIIRPTAHRFDMPIHTTDAGFARHAGVLEQRLRQPGEEEE